MGRKAKFPVKEFLGIPYYRKPSGYYKSDHKKHGGKYMHRAVWAHFNGEIQSGCHVHHKDGDRANNDISNLELLAAAEHVRGHAIENHASNQERMLRGIAAAQQAARAWHASEEGREWHREHGKDSWIGRETESRVCRVCGKSYQLLKGTAKRGFCSPSCQQKARRESGVDDVDRACAVCGTTFRVNRYSRTKTCGHSCWRAALSASRRVRPHC